jgi:predicted RNA polymerase sigma factor
VLPPGADAPSRVALTLRAVSGLSTAEIARAFLVPEATVARRISRAKQRIKAAGASFDCRRQLSRRSGSASCSMWSTSSQRGLTATSGAQLLRAELTAEAIRLARKLHWLTPATARWPGSRDFCC